MSSPKLFLAGLFAAVLLSCNGQQNNNDGSLTAKGSLDSFIISKANNLLKTKNIPGIIVAVTDGGKKTYYSAGYAVPDKKIAFDSLTYFEAGSITKTFTAYVLESVLSQKKISDSTSIARYLPDSVKQNAAVAGISFIRLLNHTSGLDRIPDDLPVSETNLQPYKDYTINNLFSYLKRTKLLTPGTYSYSNTGFALSGVLAERISGKPYEQLLNELIFSPWHMSAMISLQDSLTNVSEGYFGGQKAPYWNMNCMSPCGALKCRSKDILVYLEHLFSAYGTNSGEIINRLLEPTTSVNAKIKVCRAWHTLEESGKTLFYWHNGGTYGFSTFTAFSKESKKGVIVVINKFNSNNVSDGFGMEIMKKLMNDK